jgi:TolB protein
MLQRIVPRLMVLACACLLVAPAPVLAQGGPLRIEITEGVIEPLPVAVPVFVAETPQSAALARELADLVAADLAGTGLFRAIPRDAHISAPETFDAPVRFADWKAINAQALVVGSVRVGGGGRIDVKFRLYDVFSETALGDGLQLGGRDSAWRRIAHKLADQVYSRITGESGYFDSRIVFVSEEGPKDNRLKRLAIMDYDGAGVAYLTDSSALVLAPRYAPDGRSVLYTSYETGVPEIYLIDLASLQRRALASQARSMSFAPRFSPDGNRVVYSLTQGGNTDLYIAPVRGGQATRLTSSPSIETAPSFSPDGGRIVFESDRSGTQQLYIMSVNGGEARRISFGQGRYGTPVWSPRGDLIAFTKQNQGRFHIGVMRTDGSEERLLTASFLDEGPTWAPNGRVIMFTRESSGASGGAALYSVDISGRNLKRVPTPAGASDPAWSPLLE